MNDKCIKTRRGWSHVPKWPMIPIEIKSFCAASYNKSHQSRI